MNSALKERKINKNIFNDTITKDTIVIILDSVKDEQQQVLQKKKISEFEQKLIDEGLVNIKDLDSTIVVDLRYSTENNFMKMDVYGDWENAYLQPDVAEKLVLAQHFLQLKHPNYKLIIFDAVRPVSVQQKMWETLDLPMKEKTKYLSPPKKGSLHNFGAAVDLSIVDEFGEELDMGTEFDFFGELAYPRKEIQLMKQGKITPAQINNRQMLREVMRKAGWTNIETEWWHFNSVDWKEAKERYDKVE